jgi:hypothetical protein
MAAHRPFLLLDPFRKIVADVGEWKQHLLRQTGLPTLGKVMS